MNTQFKEGDFIRTCQECGHKQKAKDPATYKNQEKQTWRDLKCRKCGSEAMDYGKYYSNDY